MARTWHFHVNLRIAELSLQEEVRDIFKEILNTANDRLQICGLKQSSFSYDPLQDGVAQISGYLHVNKIAKLTEAAVRTWMFDDRIIGDIVWTPIRRYCMDPNALSLSPFLIPSSDPSLSLSLSHSLSLSLSRRCGSP